jgi:sugar phosphate isomerase/epimerase
MVRILLCLALLAAVVSPAARGDDSATTRPAIYVDHAGLSKLGWQLACIGSTFQDRSVFDMIDLLHSMNFHHIELSAGQIDPTDVAASDALVAKLKSVHMDIVSIGIVDPGKTESEARIVFDLGKRLKIKTIVADPADETLEMLDKLANEYRINVAIVNLAKPGNHWDPDALRGLLAGRSARVGVCADVAAWRASGISPAEAAKTLAGHILEVRLGNFDDSRPADVLGELKADKFRGICAVGCPDKPADDLIDRFTGSINAFSKIVGDLSGLQ